MTAIQNTENYYEWSHEGDTLWCIILSHYKYKNITPASPIPL